MTTLKADNSNILTWATHKDEICRAVMRAPGMFKIFLKVKDDQFFLGDWVKHHEQIVGKENLFIFDNSSSHPIVLNTLHELSENYNIFKFDGFHNDIHDTRKFPELYNAICESSTFFSFLDADERLIFVKDDKCSPGSEITKFLTDNSDTPVFPGTWVSNARNSSTIFNLGHNLSSMNFGVTNGKPIINTKSGFCGFLNHNIDVAQLISNTKIERNFIVLHLNRLYPQQRIESNLNKLIARRFLAPGDTAETALNKDLSNISDGNIISYVTEISALVERLKKDATPYIFTHDDIEITNNTIIYFSSSEKELMDSFIDPTKVELSIDKANRAITLKSTVPPNYTGYIECLNNTEIRGWAVDHEGQPCWINITINDSYILKIKTDRSRMDLKKIKLTAGLGGFRINPQHFLDEGENHISISFPDGVPLANGRLNVGRETLNN